MPQDPLSSLGPDRTALLLPPGWRPPRPRYWCSSIPAPSVVLAVGSYCRRVRVEVVGVDEGMAYTLGFERFNGSIDGRPVEPVLVRVTHIYRREDGAWKILHRHADNPGPDTRMERL